MNNSNADSYCFLIPVYNHGHLLQNYIDQILSFGLKVLLVDDGSNPQTKNYLLNITKSHPEIQLIELEKNCGKGMAMKKGLDYCQKNGLTHAFQIDADGQHVLTAVPDFIDYSRRHPKAVVAGYPCYDKTVPALRKNARKITNFFVSVETLTPAILDAMIGFRIYPVEATLRAYRGFVGARMTIDMELLVRLYWAGSPVFYLPVKVTYPPAGSSNFRMVRDNVLISLKHIQLIIRMIFTFPLILFKNSRRQHL